MDIKNYLSPDFSLTDFPSNAKVLDIGCGSGFYLRQLIAKGYLAFGTEPDKKQVAELQAEAFKVEIGYAENLPYPANSFDAILCSVVIPYTNERAAIAEWARVLVPGGKVNVSYHGFGYGMRLICQGKNLGARFYGLRMLVNTAVYRLTGLRLPSWLGDTMCQSEKRLLHYYSSFGFKLLASAKDQRLFMGQPVFIYHNLVKETLESSVDKIVTLLAPPSIDVNGPM